MLFEPKEIIQQLNSLYGPIEWSRRREPVPELIVTILSQHTSDLNAERSYDTLMDTFGSLESVADANVDEIAAAIRHGGLAQQKAPRIKQALNIIREKRGWLELDFLEELSLEDAKAWLMSLPGVGNKTTAVVLCSSFGMPAMAVDTHVRRVAKRLGLIEVITTADQAHEVLEEMLDPWQVYSFHVYLITHGRRICKAIRPLCDICPLVDKCLTGQENLQGYRSSSSG